VRIFSTQALYTLPLTICSKVAEIEGKRDESAATQKLYTFGRRGSFCAMGDTIIDGASRHR
jgi:hypothetical protein